MKKGRGVPQTKVNCAGLVRLSAKQDRRRHGIHSRLGLRNKTDPP